MIRHPIAAPDHILNFCSGLFRNDHRLPSMFFVVDGAAERFSSPDKGFGLVRREVEAGSDEVDL